MSIRCVRMLHQKCRQGFYPSSNVKRFAVPEEKVSWAVEYPEYKPVEYNAAALLDKPWADPDIHVSSFKPKWNALDGNLSLRLYLILIIKLRTLIVAL